MDSVSIHTNDNTEFDEFRRRWPNTAFICVMHATKNGDFRVGQAWTHDCDVIIKVEDGQAEQRGRFGMGEFDVFEDMLAED